MDNKTKEKKIKKIKEKKPPKEKRSSKEKKQKEEYILVKNTKMKVLRVILWAMISFIFIRGVMACLTPNRAAEVNDIIENFEKNFAKQENSGEEILGFAQNFVKEYLTYSEAGEGDFKTRIAPYVSDRIKKTAEIYDFRHSAQATYVGAYRKERYSENQWDVYVRAEVEYMSLTPEGEKARVERCTLKVPVSQNEGRYCIEGLPTYVDDQILDTEHTDAIITNSIGTEIDSSKFEQSIINFLKAYYTQEQGVIDYYLTSDADRNKFEGLDGRYEFKELNSIKAYSMFNNPDQVLCILTIKIIDTVNGNVISQEFNISAIASDRIYIKDINTRSVNLRR